MITAEDGKVLRHTWKKTSWQHIAVDVLHLFTSDQRSVVTTALRPVILCSSAAPSGLLWWETVSLVVCIHCIGGNSDHFALKNSVLHCYYMYNLVVSVKFQIEV